MTDKYLVKEKKTPQCHLAKKEVKIKTKVLEN